MFIYEVKKDDCKLQICVSVSCAGSSATYKVVDVRYIPKRKRKPVSIATQITSSYEYRHRDYCDRESYVKEQYLKYCTEEDIENAIQYTYSMIKPTLADVVYRAI